MSQEVSIFYMLAGGVLIVIGWRLFWLFVGTAGFLAGLDFAQYIFKGQSEISLLVAAICCALIGIVLALLFQEIVIILAGAVTGGTLALHWATSFIPYDPASVTNWIVFGVGAIVGGLLMAWGFNIALIIVTSLLGASLIVSAIPLDGSIKLIVAICLTVLGIYIQGIFLESLMKNQNHRRRNRIYKFLNHD